MAVVVERGEAGAAADPVGAEPVHEPVGADDLVVAHVVGPARAGRAAAPEVAGRPAEAADVGEQRAVGPEAGVDDADHDTGPAETWVVGRGRGATGCGGGQATYGVRLDRGHCGVASQVPGLGGGHPDGVPVERGRPAVDRGTGTDGREGGVLLGQRGLAEGPGRHAAAVGAGARTRQRDQEELAAPGVAGVARGLGVRLVGDGSRLARPASDTVTVSVRAHASRVLTSTRRGRGIEVKRPVSQTGPTSAAVRGARTGVPTIGPCPSSSPSTST